MLSNCEKCGVLFNKIASGLCPTCIEKEDEQFEKVRKYLHRNPNASMSEVSEQTEVEPETIEKFLRDGRLQEGKIVISEELTCISCGAQISIGSLCRNCAEAITGGTPAGEDSEDLRGMHIRKRKP